MMFGKPIGFTEILIILFIVLLIFGASRLPQLATAMGKGIRLFKKSLSGEEVEEKPEEKQRQGKKAQE